MVSSVFLFRGDGGQSASGAVKGGCRRASFGVVFCGEWRPVSFRGCEGGRGGQSALEFGGGVVGFFVSGGRGPVSFRGCEGGRGGQSALEFGGGVVGFWGDGGQSASGAVKGMEASQLWSCVLRGMEASQLPGL